MKRIILTESQYKRLVRRPLNEEVSDEGEKVTDFNIELEGNNIRRWNDNNPEHVERIQKMLKSLNYDLGYYGPNGDGVDGIYGPFTEKAVEEFQENEMPNQPEQWDGIIGPITYEILKDAVKELSDEEGVEDDDLLNNDVENPTIIDLDNGDSMVTNNFECIPTKWEPIFDLINQAESKSYESLNPGTTVSKKHGNMLGGKHPTELTFKEIADILGKGPNNTDNPAVGMWQFTSLLKQAKKAGFNEDDLFSKCNQDKIAMDLMKRKRGVTLDLIKTNPIKAGNKIAMEWAGIPVLSDINNKVRGESYYEGPNNTAHVEPEEVEDIFKKMVGDSDNENIVVDTGGDIEENNNLPDNFAKVPVGTNVFRSSQPSLSQLKYILNNYDIDTVIRMNAKESTNVSRKDEKKLVESMGKRYVFQNAHINEGGGHGKRGYEKGKGYVGSLNIVQPLLEQGNVLIHCTAGADRTGYQVARFMKDNGYCGNTDSENCRKSLWDYTIKYNSWEQYIPQGIAGYIRYMEAFYPYDDWKEEIG